MSTPAISPFTVDPITIPRISGLAAGVNHALKPSKTPRIPPSISPSSALCIVLSPAGRPALFFYSTDVRNPLARPEENQQGPGNDISQQQQDPYAIPHDPAPGSN